MKPLSPEVLKAIDENFDLMIAAGIDVTPDWRTKCHEMVTLLSTLGVPDHALIDSLRSAAEGTIERKKEREAAVRRIEGLVTA